MTSIKQVNNLDSISKSIFTAPGLRRGEVRIRPEKEPTLGFDDKINNTLKFSLQTTASHMLWEDAVLEAKFQYIVSEKGTVTCIGNYANVNAVSNTAVDFDSSSVETLYHSLIGFPEHASLFDKITLTHGSDTVATYDNVAMVHNITQWLTAKDTQFDPRSLAQGLEPVFYGSGGHAIGTYTAEKFTTVRIPLNTILSSFPTFADHAIAGELELSLELTKSDYLSEPIIPIGKLQDLNTGSADTATNTAYVPTFLKPYASVVNITWSSLTTQYYLKDVVLKIPTLTQINGVSPNVSTSAQTLRAYVTEGGPISQNIEAKLNLARASIKYIAAVAVVEDRKSKIVEMGRTFALSKSTDETNLAASNLEDYNWSRYGAFNYHQLPMTKMKVSIANTEYLPGRQLLTHSDIHDEIAKEFHEYDIGLGIPHAPLLSFSTRKLHNPPLPRYFHFVESSVAGLGIKYLATMNEHSEHLSNMLESDITSYRRNAFYQPKIYEDSASFTNSNCALKSIYFYSFTKKPGIGKSIMTGINSVVADILFQMTLKHDHTKGDYDDLKLKLITWVDGIATLGGPQANIVITA